MWRAQTTRLEEGGRPRKAVGRSNVDRTNKNAEVIAMTRAKARRWLRHQSHGLEAAHGSRLREHPGQQSSGYDQVVQEHHR